MKQYTLTFIAWLACTLLSSAVVLVEDFEPPAYTSGSNLSTYTGWSVPTGSATITDQDAYLGAQAVELQASSPNATEAARDLSSLTGNIQFLDLYVKPVATTPGSFNVLNQDEAVLWFTLDGGSGLFEAIDGSSSFTAPYAFSLDANSRTNDWIRLTFRQDFASDRYDLYVNGVLTAVDLALQNPVTGPFQFQIYGDQATNTYFDEFSYGDANPFGGDADLDGLPDSWETANSVTDRSADEEPDGLTNIEEYFYGTDPNNANSDSDAQDDGTEVFLGTDPNSGADGTVYVYEPFDYPAGTGSSQPVTGFGLKDNIGAGNFDVFLAGSLAFDALNLSAGSVEKGNNTWWDENTMEMPFSDSVSDLVNLAGSNSSETLWISFTAKTPNDINSKALKLKLFGWGDHYGIEIDSDTNEARLFVQLYQSTLYTDAAQAIAADTTYLYLTRIDVDDNGGAAGKNVSLKLWVYELGVDTLPTTAPTTGEAELNNIYMGTDWSLFQFGLEYSTPTIPNADLPKYTFDELRMTSSFEAAVQQFTLGTPPSIPPGSGGGGTPTVDTPSISPNGGTFADSVEVTLSTTTSGADLYYTTDGSTPTTSSTFYTTPFTLIADATVKVIGVKSGFNDSLVSSAAFTVTQTPPSPPPSGTLYVYEPFDYPAGPGSNYAVTGTGLKDNIGAASDKDTFIATSLGYDGLPTNNGSVDKANNQWWHEDGLELPFSDATKNIVDVTPPDTTQEFWLSFTARTPADLNNKSLELKLFGWGDHYGFAIDSDTNEATAFVQFQTGGRTTSAAQTVQPSTDYLFLAKVLVDETSGKQVSLDLWVYEQGVDTLPTQEPSSPEAQLANISMPTDWGLFQYVVHYETPTIPNAMLDPYRFDELRMGDSFRAVLPHDGLDYDGDGMPDDWELANGLDPQVDDANGDLDGDGFSNIDEYNAGTSPNIPNLLAPIISISGNDYREVTVTLSANVQGAQIFYTLDGSSPVVTFASLDKSTLPADCLLASTTTMPMPLVALQVLGAAVSGNGATIEYTGPFTVGVNTSITAVAVLPDDPGSLTSASQALALEDSDFDGITDAWEIDNFGDLSRDGTQDEDDDGLSDFEEFDLATSPLTSELATPVITLHRVNPSDSLTGNQFSEYLEVTIEDFDPEATSFYAMGTQLPDVPSFNSLIRYYEEVPLVFNQSNTVNVRSYRDYQLSDGSTVTAHSAYASATFSVVDDLALGGVPFVYEGFDYTDGVILSSATPASGSGILGNWSVFSVFDPLVDGYVRSPGLSFNGLHAVGNRVESNRSFQEAMLDLSAQNEINPAPGEHYRSFWVSYLVRTPMDLSGALFTFSLEDSIYSFIGGQSAGIEFITSFDIYVNATSKVIKPDTVYLTLIKVTLHGGNGAPGANRATASYYLLEDGVDSIFDAPDQLGPALVVSGQVAGLSSSTDLLYFDSMIFESRSQLLSPDGWSSWDEIRIGTTFASVLPIDSDGDGLTDEDEINIHGTLPDNPDTDGDGVDDGTEVANGKDPLDPSDQPPVAPSGFALTSTENSGRIDLNWTDNANNEEGYRLYRKIDTVDADFVLIATLPVDQFGHLDTDLLFANRNLDHSYRIEAYNAIGTSSVEATIQPSFFDETIPLVAADTLAADFITEGFQGVASSAAILLSWQDNSSSETGYNVRVYVGPSASIDPMSAADIEINDLGATTNATRICGLSPDTTYTIFVDVVRVLESTTESLPSAPLELVVSHEKDGGGQPLSQSAPVLTDLELIYDQAVRVSWTATGGEVGFVINRTVRDGGGAIIESKRPVGYLDASEGVGGNYTYSDFGLSASSTHEVTVSAVFANADALNGVEMESSDLQVDTPAAGAATDPNTGEDLKEMPALPVPSYALIKVPGSQNAGIQGISANGWITLTQNGPYRVGRWKPGETSISYVTMPSQLSLEGQLTDEWGPSDIDGNGTIFGSGLVDSNSGPPAVGYSAFVWSGAGATPVENGAIIIPGEGGAAVTEILHEPLALSPSGSRMFLSVETDIGVDQDQLDFIIDQRVKLKGPGFTRVTFPADVSVGSQADLVEGGYYYTLNGGTLNPSASNLSIQFSGIEGSLDLASNSIVNVSNMNAQGELMLQDSSGRVELYRNGLLEPTNIGNGSVSAASVFGMTNALDEGQDLSFLVGNALYKRVPEFDDDGNLVFEDGKVVFTNSYYEIKLDPGAASAGELALFSSDQLQAVGLTSIVAEKISPEGVLYVRGNDDCLYAAIPVRVKFLRETDQNWQYNIVPSQQITDALAALAEPPENVDDKTLLVGTHLGNIARVSLVVETVDDPDIRKAIAYNIFKENGSLLAKGNLRDNATPSIDFEAPGYTADISLKFPVAQEAERLTVLLGVDTNNDGLVDVVSDDTFSVGVFANESYTFGVTGLAAALFPASDATETIIELFAGVEPSETELPPSAVSTGSLDVRENRLTHKLGAPFEGAPNISLAPASDGVVDLPLYLWDSNTGVADILEETETIQELAISTVTANSSEILTHFSDPNAPPKDFVFPFIGAISSWNTSGPSEEDEDMAAAFNNVLVPSSEVRVRYSFNAGKTRAVPLSASMNGRIVDLIDFSYYSNESVAGLAARTAAIVQITGGNHRAGRPAGSVYLIEVEFDKTFSPPSIFEFPIFDLQ